MGLGLQLQIMILIKPNLKIIFPILIYVVSVCCQTELNWGLYRWIENQKSQFQPSSKKSIELSHPSTPYLSLQIQSEQVIKQKQSSYNISQYSLGPTGKIITISEGKYIQIQFFDIQQITINVRCSKQECKQLSQLVVKQINGNQNITKVCKFLQSKYQCNIKQKSLSIKLTLDRNKTENRLRHTASEYDQIFKQSTASFMKIYNIQNSSTNLQMVQQAFTELVSSICLFKYDEQFYLGYCELNRNKKWNYNFKLAPFSIYLMADYHYGLAYIIYQDFFALIETVLLYPTKYESQILPLPQHIQIFTRFGGILALQNQAQLLNSMFVVPMLNQLGTLHEQLNYRQAKKLHPLLLKMLSQKWSSKNSKSSLKSIYEQSFTEDYKYHDYGEALEQSICKMSWIFKVIDTFTGINIKHHSYYMPVEQVKQHLQEHFTLLNIFKVYANDENNAKVGKYKDIIDVGQKLKLYSRYNGYDAIFPYVYGLGKTYPEVTVKQLQTNFGLKSSNQEDKEQYEKKYRYRGDIHTYFNVKLISGLLYRAEQDKMLSPTHKKQIFEHLKKVGSAAAKKLVSAYNQQKIIYTSWSSDGKGKQHVPWTQIVSVLLLKWA